MNYEEKYKEVLEKAQKELQCCGTLDCDAARQIFRFFPELAESEDERIRKEIIAFLEGFYANKNKDKWIAWLEKQGEQKPNNNTEPKFKVKIADREYNVIEIKVSAGVTFYGIEDEPNHIDYILANDCEIINEYGIKENGSPYPTKSATFSGYKKNLESIDNEE